MNQRQQLEQKLIEKALKDEAFRKLLIENPSKAIEKEFNIKMPASLKLKVLEEDAKTVFMVLPYSPPSGSDLELTEVELESVSGGTGGVNPMGGHTGMQVATGWPVC
jgi:hypothetical protein